MMNVQCLQCGREHFSRGTLNTCPVCGGNVQLLHASVFDANGIRMNQLRAALQIVQEDENRAWMKHEALCANPNATAEQKSAAFQVATEHTELAAQLSILIDDEPDIQQLLANIIASRNTGVAA